MFHYYANIFSTRHFFARRSRGSSPFSTCVRTIALCLPQLLQLHKLLGPPIIGVVIFFFFSSLFFFWLFTHDCCCYLWHYYCQHHQFLRCFLSVVWQFLIASTLFTHFFVRALDCCTRKSKSFSLSALSVFGMFVCLFVVLLLCDRPPLQK